MGAGHEGSRELTRGSRSSRTQISGCAFLWGPYTTECITGAYLGNLVVHAHTHMHTSKRTLPSPPAPLPAGPNYKNQLELLSAFPSMYTSRYPKAFVSTSVWKFLPPVRDYMEQLFSLARWFFLLIIQRGKRVNNWQRGNFPQQQTSSPAAPFLLCPTLLSTLFYCEQNEVYSE